MGRSAPPEPPLWLGSSMRGLDSRLASRRLRRVIRGGKPVKHGFDLEQLRPYVMAMQTLDPPEGRAANACEPVDRIVLLCQDRAVSLAKVAKIGSQIDVSRVREQTYRVCGFYHPERRLSHEQSEACVEDVVRLVHRQRLEQGSVVGGQPFELVKRVSKRPLSLNLVVIVEGALRAEESKIDEFVGRHGRV